MKTNSMDVLLPVIAQAVEEWRAQNSEEAINKSVKALLDKNSKEITFKLLGFKADWNGWELDHCNGRSGESSAGDFIRKAQSEAIKEWLTNVELPAISDAFKKKLQAEAKQVYTQAIEANLVQAMRAKATQDATELIKKATESNNLANYLKTYSLLNTGN
jgi:hypothetical protein